MQLDFDRLKARHRSERANYNPNLTLRVHRALSWLHRAELSADDDDSCFIFLWIAFNAAYANEFHADAALSQQVVFNQFISRLVGMDEEKLIYQLIWDDFPGSIRVLLDNRYVFKPYWDHVNGNLTAEAWQAQFTAAKRQAHAALGKRDTAAVLAVVFSRLYILRNQLVHGGATWNSSVNRSQLRDGVAILGRLVPAVIHVMMNHSNALWGDPCYPVVDI